MNRIADVFRDVARIVRRGVSGPSWLLPVTVFQPTEHDADRNLVDGEITLTAAVIGEGCFGRVVICQIPGMEKPAVAKIVQLGTSAAAELTNEAVIMRTLQHPNICAFYGALQTRERAYFVCERLAGVTLATMTVGRTAGVLMPLLGEPELRDIAHQCLKALRYLDSARIVHSDIHMNNVMMTSHGIVKLIDFGMAINMRDAHRIMIRMRQRADPPETRAMALGGICPKTDVFMLGTMLFEFMLGLSSFGNLKQKSYQTIQHILAQGIRGSSPAFRALSLHLKNLIRRMTAYAPNTRLSAQEALEHPWFTSATGRAYPVPPPVAFRNWTPVQREQDLDQGEVTRLVAELHMSRRNVAGAILSRPNGWLGIAYRANVTLRRNEQQL
eukprot:scpid74285/ scgid33663/ Sperm motility kinase Y